MTELQTIHEIRLGNTRKLMKESGLSRTEFAEKIEMSYNLLSQYIGKNPTKNIGDDTVEKIEKAFNKPKGFLDQSRDYVVNSKENSSTIKTLSLEEIRKKFSKPDSELTDLNMGVGIYEDGDPVPEGYVAIDYYPEIKASAGNGYINLEDSSPYKLFIPIVEVNASGASASHCKIFNVDGESMVPDLYPDQKVSVDTSAKKIYDGEIYAFTKGSELKIKILFNWGEEGQGGFRAVSRNPDKVRFPDEYYSPAKIESENIHIVGQYWMKIDIRKVRR
ncbi:LexA family transcriptional regulator [Acinetobacter sp. P8-3-8]|uniref:LexA family transcriptional regulator n=1 Tax=Acinetobacter sp. P8-3-8 TaxID=1029823 RepID=UPI0002DC3FEA|nr:LexA family transcriptional regulator [Acinetobacter sp. P8-3-8]